jgi:hypothetical protein
MGFLQRHRDHGASLHIDRMFRLVRQMGPPIFHLRDAHIPIMRIHPGAVATLLLPLAV